MNTETEKGMTFARNTNRNQAVFPQDQQGPTSYRNSFNSTVADRFSSRERTTRFMSATSSLIT
jgi:hypothetical protein